MDPNNRKLPKSPTSSDAAGVGLPRPSPPPLPPLSPPRKESCDCTQTSPPQPVPDTTPTPRWMKKAPVSGKVRLGEGESEKGGGGEKEGGNKKEGENARREGRPSGVRTGSPGFCSFVNCLAIAALGDQEKQGTAPSRVLCLAAASSTHSPQPLALPPLLPPRRPPAEARALATLRPPVSPPHLRRAGNAWPSGGPPGGGGRAGGGGDPGQLGPGPLNRCRRH